MARSLHPSHHFLHMVVLVKRTQFWTIFLNSVALVRASCAKTCHYQQFQTTMIVYHSISLKLSKKCESADQTTQRIYKNRESITC